jgi:hypothetical protein
MINQKQKEQTALNVLSSLLKTTNAQYNGIQGALDAIVL